MALDLAALVLAHVDSPALCDRMRDLYARLDAEIASHAPVCTNRGECCHFDTYGHLLFVTPVELAYFVTGVRRNGRGAVGNGGGPPDETTQPAERCDPADVAHASTADARTAQRTLPLMAGTERICPYQIGGRCTARDHRPIGCRIFYCDPSAQAWQSDVFEKYLAELKQIGAELGVEYRFVEWVSALEAVLPPGVDR
ncbi:MAG: hypothetical protein HUU22_05095 [Phycisphaerae bacterium]|nr:hypothetical protein [Phycisphaerae bacterium]NUQ45389.1 hypothetical protein [Phycisphaerae bacterium]